MRKLACYALTAATSLVLLAGVGAAPATAAEAQSCAGQAKYDVTMYVTSNRNHPLRVLPKYTWVRVDSAENGFYLAVIDEHYTGWVEMPSLRIPHPEDC